LGGADFLEVKQRENRSRKEKKLTILSDEISLPVARTTARDPKDVGIHQKAPKGGIRGNLSLGRGRGRRNPGEMPLQLWENWTPGTILMAQAKECRVRSSGDVQTTEFTLACFSKPKGRGRSIQKVRNYKC